MPARLRITEPAATLLHELQRQHGKLLFHLSGGCCEGSAPMCLRCDTFRIGAHDVLLGMVEDTPFFVSAAQFPYWENFQITLDVVPDGGDSFSLEAADGIRFVVHSRLLSDTDPVETGGGVGPASGVTVAAARI